MSIALPNREAPLSNSGVQKLLKIAISNPDKAHAAADMLESDPRGAIMQLFRLKPGQTQAIDNASDEELRNRVAPIVSKLRSGDLRRVRFDPGGETQLKCDCHITIES